MAYYDWNQNDKNDWQDDFIEYNIYKDCTGESNNVTKRYSSSGISAFWAVMLAIGTVLLIGWSMVMAETKCIYDGCDNSAQEGSSYCVLHNSTYYNEYKSNNYYSPNSYGSNHTSTYNNSNNTNNSSSYKPTYNSHKNEDPYNAKDYSNAEDFYDDNWDDFDCYEDAEYYYDEWGE